MMGLRSKILLFLIIAIAASSSEAQLSLASERPTLYKIELYRDGTAIWTVETRVKLESQLDIEAFNLYKAEFEANKSVNLANFSTRIINIVNDASTITGRAMAAKDFDAFLTTLNTPTGTYGVISYRFTWTNFAKTEGDGMQIGDVFAGGLYLSREEALAILPPQGLEAKAAAPKPDEIKDSMLIYYGMRSFASGEPRVLFQQAFSMNWIYILLAIITITAMAFYAARRKIKASIEVDEPETTQVEIVQSDEDLILNLLDKAGGEMYQSEITEQTGFSKSKVSAILKDLKAKGLILKIKKGKENLIRRVR